ncbi:stromal membrane-associated protein 1 isoform X1 [Electrophorus electricus]|uniref:stromal membrane-associated protein 1 isoform X1 n=1 Tax=Electrophorus electricus TaxID=8005 RepID=UPI0015D0A17A|nr:stromal membrane-associated protein 1 isoform X1 [Electrophorus electricus]
MTTRSEREKAQKLNEQHQAILSKMLREEDNKYCADCEAKGPRWASWNLGVFICIRCAGIHRNLGVHISRVKSVNLDQWTPEQIQSVQSMGNTKARQLYEAHLPDNFRRPQTDQAVEFFIRDKYEKKKYYDRNAVNDSTKSSDAALPSASSPSSQAAEKTKLEKEREKKREEKKREKEPDKGSKPTALDKKREDIQIDSRASPKKSAEPSIDLLGLDAPAVNTSSGGAGSGAAPPISDDLDIFGPMVSNPLPSSTNTNQATSSKAPGSSAAGPGAGAAAGAPGPAGGAPAPADLDLFSENSSSSSKAEDSTKKPLSKDSILSLYGSNTVPQQAAQAAMFIGASQMQFPAQPQANFQAFPGMGGHMPPTTMMGAVMGQGGAMMGQNTGMMVGMTMPNGFMGNAQAGVMGLAPGMMGAQAGAMPAGVVPPQNMYAMQPSQQTQWSMGQMNQQMSGMNLNGGGAPMAFGQPGAAMGGWVGPPSGQTLSTQLWK